MNPTPTCPRDNTPLQQWDDGIITCPKCQREYIVSISDARPPATLNTKAEFASLVLAADIAQYGPPGRRLSQRIAA